MSPHLNPETQISFSHYSFSPEMKRAIDELGFTAPTPIQLETLPILLKRPTDFLGLAATGTGKTAAF
jgi:ATP-dependent RNA helicase DeaD